MHAKYCSEIVRLISQFYMQSLMHPSNHQNFHLAKSAKSLTYQVRHCTNNNFSLWVFPGSVEAFGFGLACMNDCNILCMHTSCAIILSLRDLLTYPAITSQTLGFWEKIGLACSIAYNFGVAATACPRRS
ncbi:unnamed protein product [Orchesella dallaii]|uniref:Uncharacterized protein n=1 Tax=Orchesella dallaii TaxID=48710 RepID=A0ABP1QDV1_9HEXA